MALTIKDHKLIGNEFYPVEFVQAKHYTKRPIEQKYIIIHFTAGRSYEKSLRTLTTQKVSSHLLIGREAEIAQLVDFRYKAWHAGRSRWNGLTGMNQYSIGIELDNAGKLTKIGPKKWKTWFNEIVDDESEVYTHTDGTHWHSYTKKQLEALTDVLKTTMKYYNISSDNILHHSDIAPRRKVDAGPAFPMEQMKNNLK